MMNLLEETIQAIAESGHTPEEIIFIGSEKTGHQCSWAEFQQLADFEYDYDYGSQKIAIDLIIVFSDGARMWREEHGGAEWWKFLKPFVRPAKSLPIQGLVVSREQIGWCALEQMGTRETE